MARCAELTLAWSGLLAGLAHLALSPVLQLKGQLKEAVQECETAVRLNPNLALAHHELAFSLFTFGRLEESVDSFDQAIRLSPNDPSRWNFYLLKGFSLTCLGQYERAIESLQDASRLRSSAFWRWKMAWPLQQR